MEKFLNEQIISQIEQVFEQMKEPVQILFFGSQEECDTCSETRRLLEEVAAIDDRVGLSIYDLQTDAELAGKLGAFKAPGVAIVAKNEDQLTDFGIRFSGIPSGHEFSTLINDIVLVSGRDSRLSQQAREALKNLQKPLDLQVFVTPTCPYCPQAVLLAHQMAMENPAMIRAEGIQATEFPDLANQFNVRGVPQTVINAGSGLVVGAVPERDLLAEIMRAVN
jgi:glutaredoxin-like protein